MNKRVSFKFELVSRESEVLPYFSGLVGAVVMVNGGTQHARTGTVKEVDGMGLVLVSPTGTLFGHPWEGIERLELLDR